MISDYGTVHEFGGHTDARMEELLPRRAIYTQCVV